VRLARLQRLPDGKSLTISWEGNTSATLSVRNLRLVCPCAHCIHEVTGQVILDPSSIVEDLTLKDMQPVGNDAYRILFSDGHDSGIFTLDHLHRLSLAATS